MRATIKMEIPKKEMYPIFIPYVLKDALYPYSTSGFHNNRH